MCLEVKISWVGGRRDGQTDRQSNVPPGLTAAFGAVGQLVERRSLHPKIILELQEERLLPAVAAEDKGPVTWGQGDTKG